jgi:hypothetical protein
MDDYYTIQPEGGLCNKLRVLLYHYNISVKLNKKFIVIWKNDRYCNGLFLDYFQNLDNTIFIKNNDDNYNIEYKGCSADIKLCNYNLLNLKIEIIEKINFIKNKYNKYISLHIRRTDHIELAKKKNLYVDDDIFIDFINQNLDYDIYIATDNRETQDKFYNLYKNRIKYIKFIDNIEEINKRPNKDNSDKTRHTDLLDSIIDLYICVNSDKFMGTKYSSFSDTINQMRINK